MTRPQRWAAAVAILFVGGCELGFRPCTTDQQCAANARCDVAHKVCVLREGGDESVNPTPAQPNVAGNGGGTVTPSTASEGGGGGGATGGSSEGTAAGGAGGTVSSAFALAITVVPPTHAAVAGATTDDVPIAYRRNESAWVWVQANAPMATVALSVRGSSGTEMPATRAADAQCAGGCSGACACFRVDAWLPPFDAFRGALSLSASATSMSGQTARVDDATSLKVTRLLFRRELQAGTTVEAPPALGPDGTLFVQASGAPAGLASGFAVASDGELSWQLSGAPSTSAPVVLAAPNRPIEVHWPLADRVVATSAVGAPLGQCLLSPGASLKAAGGSVAGSSFNSVFFANGAHALITASSAPTQCTSATATFDIDAPTNLVVDNDAIYGLDRGGTLHWWQRQGPGFAERTQPQHWPVLLSAAFRPMSMLLPSDKQLAGAGATTLGATAFELKLNGKPKLEYGLGVLSGLGSSLGHPVLAAGETMLAGAAAGGLAAGKSGAFVLSGGEVITAAPVLGQGGRAYTVGAGGQLTEWRVASPPTRVWSTVLEATAFVAAPTLDCTRGADGVAVAGRPGVLYAVNKNGTVFAIAVDARGLDVASPWPKYQHDPRNSGNRATALSAFSCP